jgi:hypothetical protein
MATISTSSIVDGQIIYAEHVLRIINALNGTASNEIIIADSLIQGNVNNSTDGSTSHAQGLSTDASGQYSHAEGQSTIASGQYSHAEGTGAVSSGVASHAEGRNTLALGQYSHAEGRETIATNDYSHAEGYGTETGADHQLAAGQFNTTGNTTDYVIIGFGADAGNRADALGVNAAGTYISSALYLPTLLTSSQTGVITYDTSTKQIYYTSSADLVVSQSLNSATASFVTASNVYGPFGSNSVISSSHAVTASYVDLDFLSFTSESLGANVIAVNAATTTILPRSPIYNNGTGGIGAYLTASIVGVLGATDGITLIVGDTLLVKNQANQIQNGIYEVISTGSVSTTYLLSRSLFSDETEEFDPQVIIPAAGTINRGLAFSQNTNNPIIGINNIVYSQQTGVFVSQQTTGTQTIYQIPWWTGVNRQLSRGSNNFKYINVTVGPNVTTSSLVLTGSLTVSGGLPQSSGSGHVLTYNTSSGVFSYTSSADFVAGYVINANFNITGSTQSDTSSFNASGDTLLLTGSNSMLVTITNNNATTTASFGIPTNAQVTFGGITSSLFGTASWAASASYINLVAGPNTIINYELNGIAISSSNTVGGPNQSVQFNDAGTISGSSTFNYNKVNNTVNITGSNPTSASLVVTNGMVGIGNNGFTPAPDISYGLHSQKAISASFFNIPFSTGGYRFGGGDFSSFRIQNGFQFRLRAAFSEGFTFEPVDGRINNAISYNISGNSGHIFSVSDDFVKIQEKGILGTSSFGINLSGSTPSAMLHVKGFDNATSSFALKIENSGSTQLLSVTNNGVVTITGSLIVSGGLPQSSGSGHVLTYNTSSGVFSYTASSALGDTPSLQQVLDFNHDLIDGNNFQGTEAGEEISGSNINAFGYQAAYQNSGSHINAFGYQAAYQNKKDELVAIGYQAAFRNSGSKTTAVGISAGNNNSGSNFTSIGWGAGSGNKGNNVITIGDSAGGNNIGDNNIFIGSLTGCSGSQNISIGDRAGFGGVGSSNIYMGGASGFGTGENSRGSNNVVIGRNYSSVSGSFNTQVGMSSGTAQGSNNIILGYLTLVNGNCNDVIAIGNGAGGDTGGNGNTQSNRFIINNNYLPSFVDWTAASASINAGNGARINNTYLYYDETNKNVGAIRL